MKFSISGRVHPHSASPRTLLKSWCATASSSRMRRLRRGLKMCQVPFHNAASRRDGRRTIVAGEKTHFRVLSLSHGFIPARVSSNEPNELIMIRQILLTPPRFVALEGSVAASPGESAPRTVFRPFSRQFWRVRSRFFLLRVRRPDNASSPIYFCVHCGMWYRGPIRVPFCRNVKAALDEIFRGF